MPRVAPITGKSDVPAEHHAVVDQVVRVFGNVRGPFSVLLHSPELAARVLPLVTFFRDESAVPPPLRSVAILSAVREREAAYVWAAQVAAARRNRVDQAVFDALASRHGAQWLVELTAVLSYFAMISEIANAFEVAPPPDGDRLPA